jgi:hypothetical protein
MSRPCIEPGSIQLTAFEGTLDLGIERLRAGATCNGSNRFLHFWAATSGILRLIYLSEGEELGCGRDGRGEHMPGVRRQAGVSGGIRSKGCDDSILFVLVGENMHVKGIAAGVDAHDDVAVPRL